MSRYHKAKERLKGDVHARLVREAEADGPVSSRLQESLRHEAAGIVDEFERLAADHGFWWGVKQSFAGSFAFALIPGVIYLVYLGTQHDFWSHLFTK